MSDFVPVNEPLLDANELKYLRECIETGWISSEGPFVRKFEKKFAARVGRKHGIAVCNGSVALDAGVAALGIGPGDEVILPTFTIVSCAAAIVRGGATPVVVDCDPKTWNMDVGQIESKITSRTKAIMVVHIYGLTVDMPPVIALAQKYGLKIIEDAAEAHGLVYKSREPGAGRTEVRGQRSPRLNSFQGAPDGAIQRGREDTRVKCASLSSYEFHGVKRVEGRPCGSFGDISTYSFYPNKLVTTGEGGMILTDDGHLAERCRSLRNLCFQPQKRFVHEELGWNFRMSNIQAALGVAQLERLDEFVAKKKRMGKRYAELLCGIPGIQLPLPRTNYAENIYWVYGIVLDDEIPFDAEEAMKRFGEYHIRTRPFFWPMHEQPVFKKMGLFRDVSCAVAERIARRGFYIPSGLALTNEQMERVAEVAKKVLGSAR